jgi:SRSO17 transposase
MADIIETVSENRISAQDVESLAEELETYQAMYAPFFSRIEQKRQAKAYLQGLMQPLPNKSIERIVLHNQGDAANAIRAMQHFMSDSPWQDEPILQRHWQAVDQDLGAAHGVLIVDSSGVPKQGAASAGVKRQWCGELGKVDNCQVGVYLGYASQAGYTLLDRRLYLPEDWFTAAYAERRAKCGIPEESTFKTQPELALEMVEAVAQSDQLRFGWLTCDEAFGRNSDFLDQVSAYVWYLAEVPSDTTAWLERPATAVPAWSGQGRKPVREQLVEGEPPSQTVIEIIAAIPPAQWSRHTIKEGSKGPIVAEFVAIRVINVRQGLPAQVVWLICRRDVFSGDIKYYLSNAPADTPLIDFVRVSGMRWPIESCFEESKQDIGLGDYQLRSWLGWHHHMTLVILAHFFLVRVQQRMQPKAPHLTLPQAILLLKAVLPQPKFDVKTTVEIVNYYQRRHAAAQRSHCKRRLARLKQLE